eukprot:TRINITY_DN20684_c0_g1_i11.p1 TRINITY_DN20684_c0_g1~~TRINITY_DN20684_c0_g1_i11.p1  ORF type:complete len:111 (-),score=1.95 TRINITY_DN20684_c0_g1_i11:461-793(-)
MVGTRILDVKSEVSDTIRYVAHFELSMHHKHIYHLTNCDQTRSERGILDLPIFGRGPCIESTFPINPSSIGDQCSHKKRVGWGDDGPMLYIKLVGPLASVGRYRCSIIKL